MVTFHVITIYRLHIDKLALVQIKHLQGLDLSNGFGVMLSLYKGSMLIGNSSAKAKGIYSLDIQTGEVSKEPILTTVGNPILCYYFEK